MADSGASRPLPTDWLWDGTKDEDYCAQVPEPFSYRSPQPSYSFNTVLGSSSPRSGHSPPPQFSATFGSIAQAAVGDGSVTPVDSPPLGLIKRERCATHVLPEDCMPSVLPAGIPDKTPSKSNPLTKSTAALQGTVACTYTPDVLTQPHHLSLDRWSAQRTKSQAQALVPKIATLPPSLPQATRSTSSQRVTARFVNPGNSQWGAVRTVKRELSTSFTCPNQFYSHPTPELSSDLTAVLESAPNALAVPSTTSSELSSPTYSPTLHSQKQFFTASLASSSTFTCTRCNRTILTSNIVIFQGSYCCFACHKVSTPPITFTDDSSPIGSTRLLTPKRQWTDPEDIMQGARASKVLRISFGNSKTQALRKIGCSTNDGDLAAVPGEYVRLSTALTSPVSKDETAPVLPNLPVSSVLNDTNQSGSEEEVIDDMFEKYSPYDETKEMQMLMKRQTPVTDACITVPTKQQIVLAFDGPDAKDMSETGFSLSLITRDNKTERRPYLSMRGRRFLRHMGDWTGFENYAGCLMHIDFTSREAEVIRDFVQWYVDGNFPSDVYSLETQIGLYCRSKPESVAGVELDFTHRVMSRLPGRLPSDCAKFIDDCTEASHRIASVGPESRSIVMYLPSSPNKCRRGPRPPKSGRSSCRVFRELGEGLGCWRSVGEPMRATKLGIIDSLQPSTIFTEGSSDVVDLCWSPDGRYFGICCVTLCDEYNRPGNLMHGSVDTMTIRMLGGHKVIQRTQATSDSALYSTVTSVKYSNDGKLMYSGSYDNTVKVWQGDNGRNISTIPVKSEVSCLTTSIVHYNTLVAGCKNGGISVIRVDAHGHLYTPVDSIAPPKKELEVSAVVFGNKLRPSWLISGYDVRSLHKNTQAGDLVIFDINAQRVATKVLPSAGRHFDIFLEKESSVFATAAAVVNTSQNRRVKSHIRLYDLNNPTSHCTSAHVEFDTEQKDINKVTVSPCEIYVTASGTDGSTHVWDRRNPNKLLHILRHGDTLMAQRPGGNLEDDDVGVTYAQWGPTNDRFYTGGSDGVVKAWDIKGGEPFIKDLIRVDSEIMSASFSPGWDMLMVGECSGRATLFSTRADGDPGGFNVDITDVVGRGNLRSDCEQEQAQVCSDCNTEGRDAARKLIREGRVVIRDDKAWAAEDFEPRSSREHDGRRSSTRLTNIG